MEAPNKPTRSRRTVPNSRYPHAWRAFPSQCATLLQILRQLRPIPQGCSRWTNGWDAEAAPDRMEPCVPTPPG